MILHYEFADEKNIGKDTSGNSRDAKVCGTDGVKLQTIDGRNACVFPGGKYDAGYLALPGDILSQIDDENGMTVSMWVYSKPGISVWERLLDIGSAPGAPNLFFTKALRAVCFEAGDLAADGMRALPVGTWAHVAFSVTGTANGTRSNAGPRVYCDGELVGDGFISQTSSGTYKRLRDWFGRLGEKGCYTNGAIGHSQYPADPDLCAAISDFRIYKKALPEDEIIGIMSESISEDRLITLAADRFLKAPEKIIQKDITLQTSLMGGRVKLAWESSDESALSGSGSFGSPDSARAVTLKATLTVSNTSLTRFFDVTVLPKEEYPYQLTVSPNEEGVPVSPTLYGLFFEDINRSADGGIYAELVQNRSFEDFYFKVYDPSSGQTGKSQGRVRNPLHFWYGDIDRMEIMTEDTLGAFLGAVDPDANAVYVKAPAGTVLINRGFCDNRELFSMPFDKGLSYDFSIWVKAAVPSSIQVTLIDADGNAVSSQVTVDITDVKSGSWQKRNGYTLVSEKTVAGGLKLEFTGEICIDMVSLFPKDVWGESEETGSDSAHANYLANPNYRLRRDMVQTLLDMKPGFLRFPGGCISEGSYIWENVYDWKDSVGDAAVRKENFNVWGYVMTLGLGYMEYFQLAEDLGAEPLPVMACGVLCQARSDYADPAGGTLKEKYISNFTDLIDFAISTDFDGNKWAALRREMGHSAPFGLHYLGVGNENWGTEFYASFESFKEVIKEHLDKYYPGYPLTIVSTAGAQADDGAYINGWRFLSGMLKGGEDISFTDGEKCWSEHVKWYEHEADHLDTIVDEHFYRTNEYLIENEDRYDYYVRAYDEKGSLAEQKTPKVFVGEYASSDKNTHLGAVAEAAVMCGFEKNSDVVRLAATAPLFNKPSGDGTYRWTPDCIWFDDRKVWHTPTYYIQQLFAKNLGNKVSNSSLSVFEGESLSERTPYGDVLVHMSEDTELKSLVITDASGRELYNAAVDKKLFSVEVRPDPVTVKAVIRTHSDNAFFGIGAGLKKNRSDGVIDFSKLSVREYFLGGKNGSGIKVFKEGVEAYTLGDFASSTFAGNLRGCFDEVLPFDTDITVVMEYGIGTDVYGRPLVHACYTLGADEKKAELTFPIRAYSKELIYSATEDDDNIYIKLVNVEPVEKRVKLLLPGASDGDITATILSCDADSVSIPNINTDEKELVTPKDESLKVKDGEAKLTLPP